MQKNFAAVDRDARGACIEVRVPAAATLGARGRRSSPTDAPDFVQRVTAAMMAGQGDLLPVQRLPGRRHLADGTAQWEKREHRLEIPVWDPSICIQCDKCALVCPHAAIRAKVYRAGALGGSPADVQVRRLHAPPSYEGCRYTLQVAPEDCTGCALCVEVCPAKDKANPRPQGDRHGAAGAAAGAERDN